jgi:hypothetical protein
LASHNSLASVRSIGRGGPLTPLLVPSYSSRGFTPLVEVYRSFSHYTLRSCLISGFDLYHHALPSEALSTADFVVLDSGGYEAYASSELSSPAQWRLEQYCEVLSSISEPSSIMAVTFDFNRPRATIDAQVARARQLMNAYPGLRWDLLVKPGREGDSYVDPSDVLRALDDVEGFAAIGLVEDEVGGSLLDRGRILAKLRTALSERGHSTPIHLFGCLDPLLIPYYVAAGADIFDGLEWLRYSFTSDGSVRVSSQLIKEQRFREADREAEVVSSVQNLAALGQLQRRLRIYCSSGDESDLMFTPRQLVGLRAFAEMLNYEV